MNESIQSKYFWNGRRVCNPFRFVWYHLDFSLLSKYFDLEVTHDKYFKTFNPQVEPQARNKLSSVVLSQVSLSSTMRETRFSADFIYVSLWIPW